MYQMQHATDEAYELQARQIGELKTEVTGLVAGLQGAQGEIRVAEAQRNEALAESASCRAELEALKADVPGLVQAAVREMFAGKAAQK